MRRWRRRSRTGRCWQLGFSTLAIVSILVAVRAVVADTMWVPTVELREDAAGQYTLEAVVARALIGTAVAPALPIGCVPGPEPVITDQGRTFLVRYALDCRESPLTSEDEIVLPWNVDGIQLTARWADGEERRALLGKEQAGVVIRLSQLMPRRDDPAALTARYIGTGVRHFMGGSGHILLILVLALMLPVRPLVPVLAGFTAGHALSLPLAELGVLWVPTVPAEATVAAAIVVFAAVLGRGGPGLPIAAVLVGLVHGLGLATLLAADGLFGGSLVTAVFATCAGFDATGWAIGIGLSAVAGAVRGRIDTGRWRGIPSRALITQALGIAGAALMFGIMAAGLRPEPREVRASATMLPAGTAATSRPGAGMPAQLDAAGRLTRPLIGYLIIEPYQVRLEVLVSATAVSQWIEVPQDDTGLIPTDTMAAFTRHVAELLAARTAVVIDGANTEPDEVRASFVTIGPTGVAARQTPEAEPAENAVVGATLVFETEGLAESVDLEWGLFASRAIPVPMTVTDPAAVAESEIFAQHPGVEWKNTLEDFALPVVGSVQTEKPRVPIISLLLLVLAAAVLVGSRRPGQGSRLRSVAIGFAVAAWLLYPFARVSAEVPVIAETRLSEDVADDVVERLLTNVYRSFDIHDEEAIYDRLALTVTGEQLLDVYLESRRALELENRGGARVRIDDVIVREIRSVRRTDSGYEIEAVWTVGGSVNHFGHEHFRLNRYDALIRVVPVDGVWKIDGVEVAEQRRVL